MRGRKLEEATDQMGISYEYAATNNSDSNSHVEEFFRKVRKLCWLWMCLGRCVRC